MAVCTADPTCCDVLWDAQCADAAYDLCGGCELVPSGPCDEPHGLPGCDDAPCCGAVCEFDPLCCSLEFGWDAACVAHAIELCDLGPTNDDCTDAPEIFDGFTPFTIANAVNDGPSQLVECIWDNTFLKDIWYEYTSTCTGTLEVSACTQTSYTTWVGAYADCGCPQDTLDLIDCAFANADCIGGEILTVPVVAGQCYKVRVAAGNDVLPSQGGGLVHIACRVPGDDVGDGSDLGSMEGTVTFDTQGATTDGPPHPGCLPAGDDQIHHDIWYLWTAPSSGRLTVDTCGAADFDTRLAVYDGCTAPPTDANLLGCNDDGTGCAGGTSRLNVSVVAGQCYLIRLGGAVGATGTGQMTIALSTCPADIDGGGSVGVTDFLLLLASWGPCAGCPADLDGDDVVGVTDFLLLLATWGPCP